MQIQNNGPGALSNAAEAVGRTATEQGAAEKARLRSGGADAVTVSAEAQLLKTLSDQAAEPPAIRQDVVDRMKALLDAGAIGADPGALADAMIDDLIK